MATHRLLHEWVRCWRKNHADLSLPSVLVVGAETYPSYNRIQLAQYLSGEFSVADLLLQRSDWCDEHGMSVWLGDKAMALHAEQQLVVEKASGVVMTVGFQQLVIATGSQSVLPANTAKWIDQAVNEVSLFRQLSDVDHILRHSKIGDRVMVLGAGLAGIEAALALAQRQRQVTLVHRSDRVLSQQLHVEAAQVLQCLLAQAGVHCLLNASLDRLDVVHHDTSSSITSHFQRLVVDPSGVNQQAVSSLTWHHAVIATGIRPNVDWLQDSGLLVDRGVVVDGQGRSSHPNIYALGECSQWQSAGQFVPAYVAPIVNQARVVANALLCSAVDSPHFVLTTEPVQLNLAGIQVYAVGHWQSGADRRVMSTATATIYRGILLRPAVDEPGWQLQAIQLVGDWQYGAKLFKWFKQGRILAEGSADWQQLTHWLNESTITV